MIMSVAPDLGTCTSKSAYFTFLGFFSGDSEDIYKKLHIKAIITIKGMCVNGFKTIWTTVLKGQ